MKQPRLDPRLRRLTADETEPHTHALDRVFATRTAAPQETTPPSVEERPIRVLVQLRGKSCPKAILDCPIAEVAPGIGSLSIAPSALPLLERHELVEFVEAGRPMGWFLDTSVPAVGIPPVHATGRRGQGVIVGIIDYGFDFTLDDFRRPDGSSRVAFLWDQELTAGGNETSPVGFGYGVEYDRAAIEGALQSADAFAVVRHRPREGAHGTHVASIAAGNGRTHDAQYAAATYFGVAPEADLIFVQPTFSSNAGTFTDSVHVADAISYVFRKATELGKPCVINMSLGQNGGSHDGESVVERAIDQLLEEPDRVFVVAAGNENIWRGHASGHIAPRQTRTLSWKVGGGMPWFGGQMPPNQADRSANELEVWYSSRHELAVRVEAPDGTTTSDFQSTGETDLFQLGNDTVFVDSERFTVLNGDARIYVQLDPPNLGTLQSGTWRIHLQNGGREPVPFDAWIERDWRDSTNGYADQSFFEDLDFDGKLTLGTPATGRRSIAVANYNHASVEINASSGRGTTRDGRLKPEVTAPGSNILAANSLAGRTNSQGKTIPARTTMTGTSMAAPHVAGIAALILEKQPGLTAEQVRAVLVASARNLHGMPGYDAAWGFGVVQADAALDLL